MLNCTYLMKWEVKSGGTERSQKEIRYKIAQAKLVFNSKQNYYAPPAQINNRKMLLKTRNMYGCETWKNKEAEIKRLKLNAFEMWCYRRMLKIK